MPQRTPRKDPCWMGLLALIILSSTGLVGLSTANAQSRRVTAHVQTASSGYTVAFRATRAGETDYCVRTRLAVVLRAPDP